SPFSLSFTFFIILIMSKCRAIVWPKVILFGDSITQVYLQTDGVQKLKCDVVNRGLSGYNSRWAKILLPRLLETHNSNEGHIAAVTVFFGANDSALKGKREVGVLLTCWVVTLLSSAGVEPDKVIFITPPPIHEPAWEKECILKGSALNRLNAVAGQYAQACVEAAGQCGVNVLDLWTLMQKDGQDYTEYLSDGLHLSQKGNQFVSEHLWRLLQRRMEELPFILPYWADVNATSPETTLLCD
uniref:1-alkyl-2-acetylglycerophosphocholine esterase n=1 Tax=Neogobius melanostomus TaxID=47308 RepID=A0A8C6SVX3_9GOBI